MSGPDWTEPARLFRQHQPTPGQVERIEALRGDFEELGRRIRSLVHEGPERTLAMRALQDASRHANFAIVAHHPEG